MLSEESLVSEQTAELIRTILEKKYFDANVSYETEELRGVVSLQQPFGGRR